MIEGEFSIRIKIPTPKADHVEVKGEFSVNSREELLNYLDQGISAIEAEGRKRIEEAANDRPE